jgi:hypothetical protein
MLVSHKSSERQNSRRRRGSELCFFEKRERAETKINPTSRAGNSLHKTIIP